MASGNYARKSADPAPIELAPGRVPARATRALTRELPDISVNSDEVEIHTEPEISKRSLHTKVLSADRMTTVLKPSTTEKIPVEIRQPRKAALTRPIPRTGEEIIIGKPVVRSDKQTIDFRQRQVTTAILPETFIQPDHPHKKTQPYKRVLFPWILCVIFVIATLSTALLTGIFHHQQEQVTLINWSGSKVYNIPVGGTLTQIKINSSAPQPVPSAVVHSSGPYAVLGKPTLTAAFIDQVMAAYHSPAAGTGQDLYNMGVQYGIDPAFALAFFLHESTMGTAGAAQVTKSLGNLRCIDGAACVTANGDTCNPGDSCYAAFSTWQDGYKAWYLLIRNYYVAERGLTTIPLIIPVYAPPTDNNNDSAYIASVEYEIDAWHAGHLIV